MMSDEQQFIVRCSYLPMWADCARRSAAKLFRQLIKAMGYELRELPSSIGAPIGSSVHAGAAVLLAHKAKTGELAPLSDAVEIAFETLRGETAKGVMWDRETPEMNTAERQVIRMTASYRQSVAPAIEPIIVEERLEARVSPRIILSGKPDVVAREKGRIRDLKAGKTLGHYKPQIGAYSLLARTHAIADVEGASVDHVPRVAITKPQPPPVTLSAPIAACETAAMNIVRSIEADLETFLKGDPARHLLPGDPWAFLANPASKLCGEKYCEAYGTAWCREAIMEKENN
jgi:hypothetical protein